MPHDDPKFASQKGSDWLLHDYGKIYARASTSSVPRLCIAASREGTRLLRDLSRVLAEPFLLLYVLVVPRGGSQAGRYQSDQLSQAELNALSLNFADFWDGDGRHSIWLRSADDGMLVYDRHNVIYAYGPLDLFEAKLTAFGFTAAPLFSVDFVHQHSYHAELDHLERELTARFADGRSDLHVGDENPTP